MHVYKVWEVVEVVAL